MAKSDVTIFVTIDSFMKDGLRDPTDEEILREAGIKVKIVNAEEMLKLMKKQDSDKYTQFKGEFENSAGKILSHRDLVELCSQGNEQMREFEQLTQWMSRDEALTIRSWRVKRRMTWRAVARAACMHWWWTTWDPPSNQIAGMSLCQQAASRLSENYMKAPWN